MIELSELVKPTWNTEQWLYELWKNIDAVDQEAIKKRVDELFYNPIPFTLPNNKLPYLQLFSTFAQLEIIGASHLMQSLKQLQTDEVYPILKQQFLDEIFHAVVFIKITYQLSSPHPLPLNYFHSYEKLYNITGHEPDLGTSLVFTNLLGEAWLGEIILAVREKNIANMILDVILADESRHLSEYHLYKKIGLPEKKYLQKRIEHFEAELAKLIFNETNYLVGLVNILGLSSTKNLVGQIKKKHSSMLKQLGMKPSREWRNCIDAMPSILDEIFYEYDADTEIPQSKTRQLFSSLWDRPSCPTQSAIFSLDVSPVGFFEKKFPSETITCLALQALSKTWFEHPELKNYHHNDKIYNPSNSYVTLAVQLPVGEDNVCAIVFKNCHEMNIQDLAMQIKNDMQLMTYCYQKVEALKREHPFLEYEASNIVSPYNQGPYKQNSLASPSVALSNIGYWGYEAAISPLLPHETVKLTLTKIERKQVWDNHQKQFVVKDMLPVGLSVDHRVYDGNIPLPHYLQTAFDQMFANMMANKIPLLPKNKLPHLEHFITICEEVLDYNLMIGFKLLLTRSQVWMNQCTYELLNDMVPKSLLYKF